MNRGKFSVLAFTLVGPMAHFRKFYTNSSSLSYPFPPRPSIAGLIAGLLGWERDSYYEKFSEENLRIGLQILSPYRKVVYTVNYLFTKGNLLYNKGRGTQVPVEFVFPLKKLLKYRIFVSPGKTNTFSLQELFEDLKASRYRWPVYLGITECMGWIENPVIYPPHEVEVIYNPEEPVKIITPVPSSRVKVIHFNKLKDRLKISSDRMSLSFKGSPYRSPTKPIDVIWEERGKAIPLIIDGEIFHLPEWEEGIYGVFLEI